MRESSIEHVSRITVVFSVRLLAGVIAPLAAVLSGRCRLQAGRVLLLLVASYSLSYGSYYPLSWMCPEIRFPFIPQYPKQRRFDDGTGC
jgi:hypothetical protein